MSIEKLSSRYPKLKQYLDSKESAIKELLNERCSILNRRDFHVANIRRELDANKEILLFLGHVVDEQFEGEVHFVESDSVDRPI